MNSFEYVCVSFLSIFNFDWDDCEYFLQCLQRLRDTTLTLFSLIYRINKAFVTNTQILEIMLTLKFIKTYCFWSNTDKKFVESNLPVTKNDNKQMTSLWLQQLIDTVHATFIMFT